MQLAILRLKMIILTGLAALALLATAPVQTDTPPPTPTPEPTKSDLGFRVVRSPG